jgi:subtilisin family serine protease
MPHWIMAVFAAGIAGGMLRAGTGPTIHPPPISPAEAIGKIEAGLLFSSGPLEVVVMLKDPPLTQLLGTNARHTGHLLTDAQQIERVQAMMAKQDEVIQALRERGGRPMMRLTRVLNAVVANADSSILVPLAQIDAVASVRSSRNYELDLANTAPYVGASALWALGLDGTGVRVAVLDSGVDYTHKNLGGAGTSAAYEAAYGTETAYGPSTERGIYFPTAKVIGGWDYVGELWPTAELDSDPDPIDSKFNPYYSGHGTHVADIFAGASVDGTHKGMAPGAKIYAFKVCSSKSGSCSGIAILSALEACLSPDNPPDPENIDHMPSNDNWAHWLVASPVDVVNLSLSEPYGMIQRDMVAAVQALVNYGVVVVCSAGNIGDKPYAVGSPAIAPGAVCAAETQPTTARSGWVTYRRDVETETHVVLNTASVGWAPVTKQISGQITVVGLACSADAVPATVSGRIALVDRSPGSCAVSAKVMYAAQKGAIGVVVGMDAGDPITFAQDSGTSGFVPTLVVSKADADAIKASVALGKTVVSLVAVPMAGSMVSTSSRGPSQSYQSMKPDIGAPGMVVSAKVGTGTGEEVFGGTSGAAPVIAGAAALLVQAFPTASPYEIKARLMNNAFTAVRNNPQGQPGVMAPGSRIGAGEVRVDKAYQAKLLAYDRDSLTPSLSFGYAPLSQVGGVQLLKRTVLVKNLGTVRTSYRVSQTYAQRPTGAVTVGFQPAVLTLDPGTSGTFEVRLQVAPTTLPEWGLNGGEHGGDGELLRQLEFSGYVFVTGGSQAVRLPWHLLPHKSAETTAGAATAAVGGQMALTNPQGAAVGKVEVFALTGSSPRGVAKSDNALPTQGGLGDGHYFIDLKSAGIRIAQDENNAKYVQFAIATWDELVHPSHPAEFRVYVDTDNDGLAEYTVFNSEYNGMGASGQSAVYLDDYGAQLIYGPYAYVETDFNSSTFVFTVPLARLGLTEESKIGFKVDAVDMRYTFGGGFPWDWLGGNGSPPASSGPAATYMEYTPSLPKYYPGAWTGAVPINGSVAIDVYDGPTGGAAASPHQTGFLLFYGDAKPGRWSQEIQVTGP